jgi:DNA processing protein
LNPDRARAWLTLHLAPGLGDAGFRTLLDAFGDAPAILDQNEAELARHVGAKAARAALAAPDAARIDAALAWLAAPGQFIVALADADYPAMLAQIADPPPLLYGIGRRALLDAPSLAVVGSRNATPQGLANAEAFARVLSEAGLAIVSGLALGIDGAAHAGALAGSGATLAVLGTGLDRVYPARHRELAHRIAREGLLLSEFALGTAAIAHHFPRRNRIISGLALGCLVVEAGLESGSLITARLAAEQGREVFAIPGSIHAPLARGCHRLIRDGAKLVETARDVLEELRFSLPAPDANADDSASVGADEGALDLLGHDPVTLDQLAARSGLTVGELSAMLLSWELQGRVAQLPGGFFQRIH